MSSTSDKDPTRKRLLEAGLEVFAAHGYEKATVRDICERAETGVNSIKYHFGDKWNLYINVMEHCRSVHGPIAVPDVPVNEKAEKQLRMFVLSMVKMTMRQKSTEAQPQMHDVLMHEMKSPTGALKLAMKAFAVPVWTLLNSILKRLLPKGTPAIERHLVGVTIMSQISSLRKSRLIMELLIAPSELERYTPTRMTDHIMRVAMATIRTYHTSE
ncbi:MAG: CerR family C-terminal domain-containing protein [Planctomycetota bacterium]